MCSLMFTGVHNQTQETNIEIFWGSFHSWPRGADTLRPSQAENRAGFLGRATDFRQKWGIILFKSK